MSAQQRRSASFVPRHVLQSAVEQLLPEDPSLATIPGGDAETIMAEAERMLAQNDPEVLTVLASARPSERPAAKLAD